jgi:hypothetical protein
LHRCSFKFSGSKIALCWVIFGRAFGLERERERDRERERERERERKRKELGLRIELESKYSSLLGHIGEGFWSREGVRVRVRVC